MSDDRKSIPPERYRQWAKPEDFFQQRTRPVVEDGFETGWTSSRVLYALYRRWAHKLDKEAVEAKTFAKRLEAWCRKAADSDGRKVEGLVGQPMNGHYRYPVWVTDEEPAEPEEPSDTAPPNELGQVRVLCDLDYLGDVLKAGSVVPWVRPMGAERLNLERLAKLDGEQWLMVLYAGRRRYVPAANVERII